MTPIRTDDGLPIGRLYVVHDNTEKKQLQRELLHSNKLEAVGRMVSGVAHDFNNVLMAVAANLSIAQFDGDATVGSVKDELETAEEAVYRGSDIIRRLLTFASNRELDLKLQSINAVVKRLATLTRHTFDASVGFEFDLDESDPVVLVETSAIEQVLLNLFVNARDAMADGGVITTRTKVVANSGTGEDWVLISVADTGAGVQPDVVDRIFEPFFTTKDADQGTGLGLPTSYRIIQRHGGALTYRPRPQGSEFQIMLPLQTADARSIVLPTAEVEKGTGTILVVDDEDVVRTAAETFLRRHGYHTLSAANGQEALHRVFDQMDSGDRQIDAVLLDLTMPGMTGREVMHQLKSRFPNLPVILCSGYLVSGGSGDDLPNAEIKKPYSVKHLVSTVNRVLAEARTLQANA